MSAGDGSESLAQAMGEYRAGRHGEAATLCERLLAREPDNTGALHLLGGLSLQAGRLERARELIGRAVAVEPTNAACLYDLAVTQHQLQDLTEAVGNYRRVLELRPDHVGALNNLGNAYMELDRLSDAIVCYEKALAIEPGLAAIHRNLGDARMRCHRLEEAAAAYRQALAIEPSSTELLKCLGTVERYLERYDAALACFRRVVEADPGDADAYNKIGMVCHCIGDRVAATAAYAQAAALQPDYVEAWSNLARLHIGYGAAQPALEAAEAALRLDPGRCSALADKAAALHELGRDRESEALLDYDRLVHVGQLEPPPGYSDLASFNAVLADALRSHPTLKHEPDYKTTRGGRQTLELFDGSAPFDLLETGVRGAIEAFLASLAGTCEHPFVTHRLRDFRLTGWGVILDSQGHQAPHMHASGWLSGIYYVSLPAEIRDDQEQAGWLEFGRCDESFRLERPPRTRAYRPEEGMLLLFPSIFWHRTIPFASGEQRVSIAFDAFVGP